ncbi:MAG: peptide/nickel transport system substrate-binding protein [Candidatus Magnetoglobus multicellularis str. Araruama]|uniref:Peptide/nickel transport system substrate-binding protein n=1 Tax=Candidatus Magnetoglobus multicellularis str. Araruama TaxID=890399 RepID=A0A1V1P8V8_9BACT|nr:MAG: peptide/nickel transport system substrate-binding protein [Candidatus Magnetoglobus multicellularis str. Araruama]
MSEPDGHCNQKDRFVFASYATLQTLDPCMAYDTTSHQRILNIYEPLIFFDGSSVDQYKPMLSTAVPSLENGGISKDGLKYTFTIRAGVRFHEGGKLTAQDVAYSFKRYMIADPDGGPIWMLLEPLLGITSTRNKNGELLPDIFTKIDQCVSVLGNTVSFHLVRPYPPFLSILCTSVGVILDKEWAIAKGCWDGLLENAKKFNNPKMGQEPLQKIANGTGAYKMKSWQVSKQFIFERNKQYWGKKPPLKIAIFKYVKEWSTRKMMLQNGDADRVTVDSIHIPEVLSIKGLSFYKVPQLSVSGALFCRKINNTANPYIGSGRLDGKGIPVDFFSDAHIRKAFLHGFDRNMYRRDVLNNMAIVPTSPNIEGLPYHTSTPIYEYDPYKMIAHLKKAWGGKVWKLGFRMTIVYNTGNEMREAAALMLAENMMALNRNIQIEVKNVDWKDYLVNYRNYMYPFFLIGWSADYADPHNFMYNFMHSKGVLGKYIRYHDPDIDHLCEQGIKIVDPIQRRAIYEKLQQTWYEDAIGILLYQTVNFRAYRDDISGFWLNPIFSDDWENLKNLHRR